MLKWLKKLFNLFRRKKLVEFATLDDNQANIPYAPSKSEYGLADLTNPDNVLSGQSRGTQSVGGSTNIQSDPSGQRLVVNDNTTNRVSFGRIGTGPNDWGMKVSKAGVPVDTATNDQLIFNSSQDVFKIVSTGTVAMPIATATMTAATMSYGSATTTIPHGLSYAPIVIGSITALSGSPQSSPLPYLGTSGGAIGPNTFQTIQTYQVSSDATNIYLFSSMQVWWSIATTRSDPTANYQCKYYIIQETAT